jgi:ribosomal protein S18 acetylase RimI-like enzyme
VERASIDAPISPILVDHAQSRDAHSILSLYKSVLTEDRWFITDRKEFVGTVGWQRRIIVELTRRENACCMVARLADEIVGVVTVQGGRLARMAHVGKIETFVDQQCRGMGVGRALMSALITWAEENTALSKLGLYVFEDNIRAIKLYRHFGFEVEGRRANEYREPDGRMRTDLLMYRWV